MKNLLTFLFVMFTLIFAACENEGNDGAVPEEPTEPVVGVCEPACNSDTEDCVCKDTEDGETACTCEVKPVEECKCDDGTTCPEGGKEACPKHEEPAVCEPACVEGKECRCEADKCECVDKVAPAPTCEPACNPDTDECVCEADKCECKPRTVEECKCEDGTPCPEGDKAKCVAAPVEDKCAGKSEGDECDTNKTCQKGEADKLECKDKPAEPAEPEEPTEPAQPE